MRLTARTIYIAALLPLAACGGADKSSNSVQMKDMEVVDGTATDAMTDLDGVQSEGTAVALPNAGASSNSSEAAKPAKPAEKAPAQDDEVLADQ
ncbi:hypothetical protein DM806_15915 [Sphingobium lactosutens]|uniref:hypothetical protein n=1 Tax=Sphingobium lactosutens TaxID=522773 RepID=UPI0015BD7C3E|nr:hypothetical protein [Sphingobium lactosutens]NWK97128.1 hypothetical protein [Sphingobium lactosutens]